jgi:hypothetical protein
MAVHTVSGRWRFWLLATAVLAAVGAASFRLVWASSPTSEVVAGQHETDVRHRGDFWYVPLAQAEREKPRLDTVLAGISLGPDQPTDTSICRAVPQGSPGSGPLSLTDALGSDLAIAPAYLPAGARLRDEPYLTGGVMCGGQVAAVTAQYDVPRGSSSLYGGWLFISRRQGEPALALDVASDRAIAAVVAGRPAVLISPLTDDGFGDSYIIVLEPWGLTAIQADGLALAEVEAVAEGLYQQDGVTR